MATKTDPLEILIELGINLDNLSEEEDYLSALMEATNILTLKNSRDPRISDLQKEIVNVRRSRKIKDPKFKVRKTKISADAIKSTSSNTLKSQKPSAQKFLPSSFRKDDEVLEDNKTKKTRKNKTVEVPVTFITSVNSSLKSILKTLKNRSKFVQKETENDRKEAQKTKRGVAETKLEKSFFKPVIEAVQKVVAPVKGILSKIFDFFAKVFLAKVVIKLMNWMSNPDNQSKLKNTIRFLVDFGPKLLGAYLLFGTRLGRFVTGLATKLIFGAARLGAAAFRMIAALPWWAKVGLAGAALFGAGAAVPTLFPDTVKDSADTQADALKKERGAEAAADAIDKQNANRNIFQKAGDFITGAGAEREEQSERLRTGEEKRYFGGGLVQPIFKFGGGGSAKFNLLDPRTWMSGKGQQAVNSKKTGAYGNNSLSGRLLNRRNATNEAIQKMRGYEEGGEVDGPGGIDKVPAMLTDGEFVMSRGAVQKYGVAELESMNAAGGGTNKPKIMNNMVYAAGGGGIGAYFNEIKERFILGDDSLLNRLAHGDRRGALEALGIKVDENTKAAKENTKQRTEESKQRKEEIYTVEGLIAGAVGIAQSLEQKSAKLYDQAMSGAAQLIDQSVVIAQQSAQQAQQLVEGIPAAAKKQYDQSIRGIYSATADPLKAAEAKRYVTQAEFDKLSPEEQLDKLVINKTNKDGAVMSTTTALTKRNQDRQTANIERLTKGLNSENVLERVGADIMNRGVISMPSQILSNFGATEGFDNAISGLTGGRLKKTSAVLSGLEMTVKGLLGPLGMPLRTDASSILEYNKPLMDFAIENNLMNSKGEYLVGKDSWSEILGSKAYATQDISLSKEEKEKKFSIVGGTKDRQGEYIVIDDKGKEQTRYTEHLYDKMQRESMGMGAAAKFANFGLGQFAFSVDQESGKAKVTDSWDSNNSAEYYFGASEAALKEGDLYNGLFKGLSGVLRMNQNSFLGLGDTGFANTLPAGIDITSRSGFQKALTSTPSAIQRESAQTTQSSANKAGYFSPVTGKFYVSYAEALKDPRIKASEDIRKKFNFSPNQNTTSIPGAPVRRNPKVVVSNSTKNASPPNSSSGGNKTSVPSINAGSADSSKAKILGFLPEYLQFF